MSDSFPSGLVNELPVSSDGAGPDTPRATPMDLGLPIQKVGILNARCWMLLSLGVVLLQSKAPWVRLIQPFVFSDIIQKPPQ